MLESGSPGLAAGTLHVVAGTVPLATARVKITDGTGISTTAKLVTPGADPSHRYFADLLTSSEMSNASLSATVVAYDGSGHEIGRSNPQASAG